MSDERRFTLRQLEEAVTLAWERGYFEGSVDGSSLPNGDWYREIVKRVEASETRKV